MCNKFYLIRLVSKLFEFDTKMRPFGIALEFIMFITRLFYLVSFSMDFILLNNNNNTVLHVKGLDLILSDKIYACEIPAKL